MAYASTSTISYLGTMAVGAMQQNSGFAPATKEIVALTRSTAGNTPGLFFTALGATQQPNSDAIRTLCNRDIVGFGAFTGVIPDSHTSVLGTGSSLDALQAHANLMFGTGPIQMAQTFFIAEGFTQTSERLAPTLDKLNAGVEFGKMPELDKLEYPANGIFPNFLGSSYEDYQAVVTNGLSSLVTSPTTDIFALLAADLITFGTAFSIRDIATFGNPGQVIAALNNVDGLGVTGLDVALANIGINPEQIYNLGAEQYNEIMQGALETVTNPDLIANAQTLLGSNIANMDSLGDYTNYDKLFVASKDVITFANMDEFRKKLQGLELGRIDTVAQLATYADAIEPAVLPTISNRTNFVQRGFIDSVVATYLGGTGQYTSITLQDMIGILGGVVVEDAAKNYRTAMTALYNEGLLNDIRSRVSELAAGLNEDYTTTVSSGPPVVININDPFDNSNHGDYESFQANKIGHIEAACRALLDKRNINDNIQIAMDNWFAISKKVVDEKDFQSRLDMNYGIRTDFADNAVSFITGLRGTINERGKGPIVKGMVDQAVRDGSIGGEYLRAYLKELENKLVADQFDVRWRAEFDS